MSRTREGSLTAEELRELRRLHVSAGRRVDSLFAGEYRAVVRVPRAHGAELSRALGELQRVRSARKLDAVRIQVDPPTL